MNPPRSLALVMLVLAAAPAHAEPPALAPPDPPDLARLVARARADNRTLRAADLDVAAAALAVRDARAARLPTVDVEARATRVIGQQLDLGELINPAYAALNQLIGEARFPTDVEATLPLGFETKVRVAVPLWAPAIHWSEQLAGLGVTARRHSRALTRREIAAAVRTAYLGHARAALVARRLRESRPLLEEHLRVSRALVAADRGFGDAVFRAEAELAAFDQQLAEVERARRGAARALAVLVAGPISDEVAGPPELGAVDVPAALPVDLAAAVAHARAARAELDLLTTEGDVARAQRGLARAGRRPTIALALDVGAQRADPLVTVDDLYAAASVRVTWNLFDGGRDRRAAHRAELGGAAVALRRAQAADQIEVSVRDAHDAARVALAGVATAATRERSTQAAYDLVAARYRAGDVAPVELLAAQTALIDARTDRVLAITDYHLRLVELVRVGALDEEAP